MDLNAVKKIDRRFFLYCLFHATRISVVCIIFLLPFIWIQEAFYGKVDYPSLIFFSFIGIFLVYLSSYFFLKRTRNFSYILGESSIKAFWFSATEDENSKEIKYGEVKHIRFGKPFFSKKYLNLLISTSPDLTNGIPSPLEDVNRDQKNKILITRYVAPAWCGFNEHSIYIPYIPIDEAIQIKTLILSKGGKDI